MANEKFTQLNDGQLMKLFAVSVTLPLSSRAKDILTELEWRGYLYDVRRGDFVPCEEWNRRHGHVAPMDCGEQARLRMD